MIQVCDIVDELFVNLFKHLEEKCKEDLEVINRQHPFEPVKVQRSLLNLVFFLVDELASSNGLVNLCSI